MSGCNLKEGCYDNRIITEDEMWEVFAGFFSTKSKNSSTYKFGLLKAIIDNLYNVDSKRRLSFDLIFSKFSEIYWNLILKHGLRQKAKSERDQGTLLEQILKKEVEKYEIKVPVPFESLADDIRQDISEQVKTKCKRYVVGAVFEDTKHLFYSFSKKEEWIQINPVMYEFICKHKVTIEKLNYYEWARFLEKVNEEETTTRLLDKIDGSAKRNNLSLYRKILFEELENKNCFYCGRRLRPSKIDVDHFIPWSFVKDDYLWNLVLACPNCNRIKNDRLPDEEFLTIIVNRNQYLKEDLHRSEMRNYDSVMISDVYKWAIFNGYNRIWKPEKMDDKL